jgi:hypothetical protein
MSGLVIVTYNLSSFILFTILLALVYIMVQEPCWFLASVVGFMPLVS